jgi:hypothetical protein
LLATLWIILELLVAEKDLFPGCEHKLALTLFALQYAVCKLHVASPNVRDKAEE